MSESAKENATHVSKFQGNISQGTSDPADSGVAGRRAGDMYYNSTDDEVRIWDETNTVWWGRDQSSTTSTSTTTTSTSTTTTSTSTTTS